MGDMIENVKLFMLKRDIYISNKTEIQKYTGKKKMRDIQD